MNEYLKTTFPYFFEGVFLFYFIAYIAIGIICIMLTIYYVNYVAKVKEEEGSHLLGVVSVLFIISGTAILIGYLLFSFFRQYYRLFSIHQKLQPVFRLSKKVTSKYKKHTNAPDSHSK